MSADSVRGFETQAQQLLQMFCDIEHWRGGRSSTDPAISLEHRVRIYEIVRELILRLDEFESNGANGDGLWRGALVNFEQQLWSRLNMLQARVESIESAVDGLHCGSHCEQERTAQTLRRQPRPSRDWRVDDERSPSEALSPEHWVRLSNAKRELRAAFEGDAGRRYLYGDSPNSYASRLMKALEIRLHADGYPMTSSLVRSLERIESMTAETARSGDVIEARLATAQGAIANFRCRYADDSNQMARLIVGGAGEGSIATQRGRDAFDHYMRRWLARCDEAIVIDPYLFKRSREADIESGEAASVTGARDLAFVERLVGVLDSGPRTVRFIYDGDPRNHLSAKVLDAFAKRIATTKISPRYFAAENLHDRVWLRRHGKQWEARVVGTSIDGIGRRPTYVIDMPERDVHEYMGYVAFLQEEPTIESRDLPVARPKRKRSATA
jgi:hypothetical protein